MSIPLFEVELAAFAQQVGARPAKQIVLVLDRAGWHASVRLRVPDQVHVLFLPPDAPELQPAEHLWLLTNTVPANRHCATINDREDTQAVRCVTVQARPDLIRSTTLFHWWPKHLKKRPGPRRTAYEQLLKRSLGAASSGERHQWGSRRRTRGGSRYRYRCAFGSNGHQGVSGECSSPPYD